MATGLLSNPWLVESVADLTYICCPECVYRTKEESTFQAHAIQNHPQSFVLFNKVEGASNQQNAIEPAPGPCNVEIKEEPTEHEQAMSDFMDFIQEEAEVDHDDDNSKDEDFDPLEGEEEQDVKDVPLYQEKTEKKTYPCPYCRIEFKKQGTMKTHMETEHADDAGNLPEVKCDECDKIFPNVRKLKRHQNGVHSIKITCKICGKTFNKNGYREHMKVAHVDKDIKEHKCDQCDFSSHAGKYLKAHKLKCHNKEEQRHQCGKCGEKFAFPYLLKKHVCGAQTIFKGPVKCPECNQELKALRYLVSHFRKSHGRLPPGYEGKEKFMCDQCSSVFLTEASLKNHIISKHIKVPEKIMCYECNQEFNESRYLVQHYKYVHNDIPPGFENKEQFMCDRCPSVFFSKLSLKQHCKTKHAVDGGPPPPSYSAESRKNCPLCEKTFSSYLRRREHIKSKHEKDTPHKCDECHRSYGTLTCLRVHKRNMHQRVKCDQCGQEICNSFMLKRHKASVHGITPQDAHQCEHCPSFFQNLKAKEKHVAKHHPEPELLRLKMIAHHSAAIGGHTLT